MTGNRKKKRLPYRAAIISLAVAAQNSDDDIVILAVKPRSPDVKPIAAAVSPSGQDIGKPQIAQANTQVSHR